jgi:hypothetical protein
VWYSIMAIIGGSGRLGDDDLPARVAAFNALEVRRDLGRRIGAVDDRPQPTGLDQLRHDGQVRPVWHRPVPAQPLGATVLLANREGTIEGTCRVGEHGRNDVGVGVHRQADLRVPKLFHYHARENPLSVEQRRAAALEAVHPLAWRPARVQEPVQATI